MRHFILILSLLVSQLSAAPKPVQRHALGWKSAPKHAAGLKQLATHPAYRAAPLPPSASVKAGMPRIYNQSWLGSCVAQATAAAMDYQWKQRKGWFIMPSRLDIYQNCLRHDGYFPRDVGTYTSTALWVLRNKGVLLEASWWYVPSNLSAHAGTDYRHERKKYAAISTYDVSNTDNGYSFKQCIANAKLPVIIGGYVFEQIYSVDKKSPFIEMPASRPLGGHAMLGVSYDDEMVHNGIKGWAEVRNSWDEEWGDKGYGWIPEEYLFNPKLMEDFGAVELTGPRVVKPLKSPVRGQSVETSPQRQTAKPSLLQRMLGR